RPGRAHAAGRPARCGRPLPAGGRAVPGAGAAQAGERGLLRRSGPRCLPRGGRGRAQCLRRAVRPAGAGLPATGGGAVGAARAGRKPRMAAGAAGRDPALSRETGASARRGSGRRASGGLESGFPEPCTAMSQREWVAAAIRKIEADFNRSADTHLIPLPLPGFAGIDVYLKDESSHPTGSLKHRLARSLFLYALANGWLHQGSTVIEASSGSTAVSEAYFARLLGLPFVAVMPASTSPEKIAAIEFQGGRCHLIERACGLDAQAQQLAAATGGHFMDQFTYAERATDWRANNNIAESIFKQMSQEPHPVPEWIVCSAGTGGTAATLGRYVRSRQHHTRILCADPQVSVFYKHYCDVLGGVQGEAAIDQGSRIE